MAFSYPAGQAASIQMPAGSGSAEIQQALDRLSEGGEIVLAPGTYVVRQPLVLQHDRQTLRGSGPTTVLYLADEANCPVVILGTPADTPRRATAHVRLADLTVDGNRHHQRSEFWQDARGCNEIRNNGVTVWKTSDALVEQVICCRCRSGGLVSGKGTRRLTVRDFTAFDNQFDGLACYETEASVFKGLCLHDNLAAGISLDLAFRHNVITNAVLTGNDLGIFMRESRDNVFQALTIRQSRNHGVFMAQSVIQTREGWRLSPHTECTNNNFSDLLISECRGKAFLVHNASCTNNLISDAQFLGNAQGGLAQADAGLVTVQGLLEK